MARRTSRMYTAFLSAPFGAGRYGSAGRSAQTERTRAHDFLPEAVGAGTGGRATTLRRRCGRGRVAGAGVAGAGEWQAEPPPGTVRAQKIPEGMSFRDFLICFYLLSKKAL